MNLENLKDVQVLIVDDDEDDVFIIKKLFEQIPSSPFNVTWTSSYKKAKQYITDEAFDIYLIDYRLGEFTGLDLLEFAEPETRIEPFILLTGAGDKEIEWRSMKLAAADYLIKGSFDAPMLSRTLYYAMQRKSIEEQRIKELLELNRSKDEFISIASHQLRTPATAVKQYVGMVLEGFVGETTEPQTKLLKKAYESNERQLRIVSDLLKVAQVDAGKVLLKKSEVSVNQLVESVIYDQMQLYAERDQMIEFTAQHPDVLLMIDADSIRMVIDNIIDNASKYSEADTMVSVTIDQQKQGVVCINVTDQGVGINPDYENRLFQKFSRLDNPLSTKVGGTGLGLYWAKKIMDLHDGTISHKANKQGGTTFTICLPKKKIKS